MRIRHIVLAVIGLAVVAGVVRAAMPDSNTRPPVLDDGTINITASEDGLGSWVPYTITVRNLGDHDFSGRLLMLKRFVPKPTGPARFQPVAALPSIASPLGAGAQGMPPDAAYQFPIALSPRHKRTYTFFAPDDFVDVLVQDSQGQRVTEGQVDNRKSVAVGVLTDSSTLIPELQPIRMGELTVRVTQWDDAHPFPDRAAFLAGYSAVVIDRYDSSRLDARQRQALSDFVGLGGELVVAGAGDLPLSLAGLPPQLLAFNPAGDTVREPLAAVAELSGLHTQVATQVAQGTVVKGARVVLESASGRPLEVETHYGAGEVMQLLGAGGAAHLSADAGLYAVAYRPIRRDGREEIAVWPELLALAAVLPTLPLALNAEVCLPVDLEATYMDACRRRRLA